MKRLLFIITMSVLGISFARAQEIKGRVTDSRDGTPLSNVSVYIKGTNTGTTTDIDGKFSIRASTGVTLVFSSIGFAEQEVRATASDLNVSLEYAQRNMQEVIVTGYGSRSRRQIAGSIAKVNGEEVKLQPVGSFDKLLQGKVPGLLSQSQSGQPGAAADVTIRGKGSINGSNAPLYVIDGVQVSTADFATLNPADIESYNVLKDASATSIYGSRGANGVIVINTKRGAAGKTTVNYDFQYGFSALPHNKLRLMNSAEKLDYEVNYDRPDGMNPFGWTQTEIDSLSKIDNKLDEILFKKGKTQQHQLSLSGGNDKTRFYISGSIFDQEGIVISTGLKRYTGRVNLENSFGDFKVGLNATYGYSKLIGTRENDQYIGSPLNAINWFNPYVTLYDPDGNYQDDFLQGQPNPLRELLENFGNTDQMKGVGSVFIEWKIPWVKGLRARTLWGGDITEDEALGYLDRTTNSGGQSTGARGQLSRAYARTFRYTGTTSVTYQRNVGAHDINVSAFNEIIKSKSENFGFTGFGLVGPFKNEAGITPGTPTNGFIPTVAGGATENGLLSWFADGTYGYNKKYYLSAGFRRDGSSRFGADNKHANFYNVGASWIVSEEEIFKDRTKWLNELKLRASYGTVGNQLGIGNFASLELLNATVYNGVGGLVLAQLPYPQLKWETKEMFNVGIDFRVLENRLSGTVEYYNNKTVDLFLDKQLSRTSGFASITANLGKLQNQGIEAALSADIIRGRNLNWTVYANYTYNKNKILDQAGQDENINGLFINKVGEKANSLYLVGYAGVDPDNGDALYYTKDGKTTTNIYDPGDAVVVGTVDPPQFGGFGTNLNWKGIQLDALFTYTLGGVIYNNDRYNVEFPGYWFSRVATSLLREWQQPGDITNIPSPFNDFHGETTRFLEKTDHLRLRNVTLSYSLPKSVLQRVNISSLKVFAQGQNLKVWHNFQGWDPEITTGILGGAQYPQLKTITFGLSLGL
ncbi:MAG TPA: TonB-dependent receptor [Chitinophagaceae bacterium]|nr:TonB-dependent receptor [Chitinophagaceae bacterium]